MRTPQNWAWILKWVFFIALLAAILAGAAKYLLCSPRDPGTQGLVEAELTRQGFTPAQPGKQPQKPPGIPAVKPTIEGQGIATRPPGAPPWPDTLSVELEIVETAGEPWVKLTIEGQEVKWQRLESFEGWPRPEPPSPVSVIGGYAITSATPWTAGLAWEPIGIQDKIRLGLQGETAIDLTWASIGLRASGRLGPVSIGAGIGWAFGEDPGLRPSITGGIAVDL